MPDVMRIETRLVVMNFLQFFVWGSWLISFGAYTIGTLGFTGSQVGSIYATMGIASLFMPGLTGIIADRWMNAERLYAICHLVGAGQVLVQVRRQDRSPPANVFQAAQQFDTVAGKLVQVNVLPAVLA